MTVCGDFHSFEEQENPIGKKCVIVFAYLHRKLNLIFRVEWICSGIDECT